MTGDGERAPLEAIADRLRELDRLLGSRTVARLAIERADGTLVHVRIDPSQRYTPQWVSGRIEALEPPPPGQRRLLLGEGGRLRVRPPP